MRYKYVNEHNNYDLTLGKEYEGHKHKDGWLLIKDDNSNLVLYREECFQRVENLFEVIVGNEKVKIICRQINGVFQDVNTNCVYGSYVFSYKKIIK